MDGQIEIVTLIAVSGLKSLIENYIRGPGSETGPDARVGRFRTKASWKSRLSGTPLLTPLSTNATCQLEKTEKFAAIQLHVTEGPLQCGRKTAP